MKDSRKIKLNSWNSTRKRINPSKVKNSYQQLNIMNAQKDMYIVHVNNFVKSILINLEKYYMPMDIPDYKLEQFVFTIKKNNENAEKKLNLKH